MVDTVIVIGLTLIVAITLWINKPLLSLAVMVVLLIIIVWRDMAIGVYYQSLMDDMYDRGRWTRDFMSGASAMVDFSKSTRHYIFLASVFIFALGARGFWSCRKRRDQ